MTGWLQEAVDAMSLLLPQHAQQLPKELADDISREFSRIVEGFRSGALSVPAVSEGETLFELARRLEPLEENFIASATRARLLVLRTRILGLGRQRDPAQQEPWTGATRPQQPPSEPTPAPAPLPAPVPAAAPPPMAIPPIPAGVDETAIATPALNLDPALPFSGSAAAPPSANEAAERASDSIDATAFTAPIAGLEDLADALPFDTDAAELPDIPDLTVEQYASLCVEREINPDQQQETLARYKVLTEQALRTLDERWQHRFATEGDLQQRWQQAFTQYQAWLKSRSSKP